MNIDHHENIIIGGGVAGLCAAIELCRMGFKPVVIESGNYPAHKICGEFLSPESLSWLNKLEINPIRIENVQFFIDEKQVDFIFPRPAGSLSHWILDPQLAERARGLGAQILTQTKVEALLPKQNPADKHRLELSTGKTMSASSIIVAAGRLNLITPPLVKHKYLGIKAHFEGIELNHSLKMFGLRGAYLGLSPIEDGKANLACLVSMKRAQAAGSVDQLMDELIAENTHLKELLSSGTRLFDQWMHAPVPFFGFKTTPGWKDSYFIGDAAFSIPPACGEGLSLAISSGMMAARYAAINDFVGFKKGLQSWCAQPLRTAKALNYLLMRPQIAKLVVHGCRLCPSLTHWLFQTSRHSSLPA